MLDGEWNNRFLCSMMPEVMACLRKDLALVRPDFILVTGDVLQQVATHLAMLEARIRWNRWLPITPWGQS